MQKKKIISFILSLVLVLGVFVISNLLLSPNINSVSAYTGTGPDANGLYYTYVSATDSYSVTGCDQSDLTVEIPATFDNGTNGEKPVMYIGGNAFYQCSDLVSVTIPNSVTTIGVAAFYNCSGLKSINIPQGVTSIGYNAFYQCSNLVSVTIPNSVTSIGAGAFYYCSNLVSINIPDGVTKIQGATFWGCVNLRSVSLPNTLTIIEQYAFTYCAQVSVINISENVTSIGQGAFMSCQSLTSVNLPNRITFIGESAFKECYNLTSITIPDSVKSIGDSAFAKCLNLTSITIPSSVTSIETNAFTNCHKLVQITNLSGVTLIENTHYYATLGLEVRTSTDTNFTNILSNFDSNGIQTFNIGSDTYLISFNRSKTKLDLSGYTNINKVYSYAFSYSENLFSVTLSDTIAEIKDRAFRRCTSLALINIPEGVTVIEDSAFLECYSLVSITIPNSVTSIGTNAFANCHKLVQITNLSSVSISIPSNLGAEVRTATDVNFTNTLSDYDDNGIQTFTVGDTVYIISFDRRSTSLNLAGSIISTTIEDSVVITQSGYIFNKIYDYGFYNCDELTSITISLCHIAQEQPIFYFFEIEIGEYAFAECSNLTRVFLKSSKPPTLSNESIDYRIANILIPREYLDTYKTDTNWDRFSIFADSYTVTFKDYDGSIIQVNESDTQTVIFGENAIPPVPVRLGYILSWNDIYNNITTDKEITANWEIVTYLISYELNGGTVSEENLSAYDVETESFTLTNPTRTGYTFVGWTGTELEEATTEVAVSTGSTENRVYTANWETIAYSISYELNGGTASEENPSVYDFEAESFTLTNPTKTGYTFVGWTGTELEEATLEATIPAGSTENRTYVANWEIITYSIYYELNDGTVSEENPASYTIENSDDIILTNPTKTGYTFVGWTGTELEEATLQVTISAGSIGDRVYVANWEVIPVNLMWLYIVTGVIGVITIVFLTLWIIRKKKMKKLSIGQTNKLVD